MGRPIQYSALVVSIPDGDGVHLVHGGKQHVCRLWGLDAPEHGQPFGPDARRFLHDLLLQKRVSVLQHGADSYGRPLVQISLPINRDAGARLIEEGLAWVYPPNAATLQVYSRLEEIARHLRLGLWATQDPIPPWIWRQTHAKHRIASPKKGPSAGRVRPVNLVDVEPTQDSLLDPP